MIALALAGCATIPTPDGGLTYKRRALFPLGHADQIFQLCFRYKLGLQHLRLFRQGTMPAVDAGSGAVLLAARDRVALSRFTFEMGDPEHLRHVLKAVRGVDGVYDAQRVIS